MAASTTRAMYKVGFNAAKQARVLRLDDEEEGKGKGRKGKGKRKKKRKA